MSFDGRMRIYPTLRCNLRCPYCVNLHGGKPRAREEIAVDTWTRIILQAGRSVVFTGGEPFLYPGFVDLLNAIPRRIRVQVYTNLTALPAGFPASLKRLVFLRATYHYSCPIPPPDFAEKVRALAASDVLLGSIHLLDVAGYETALQTLRPALGRLPWRLSIEYDQRVRFEEMSSGTAVRLVECTSRNILVGPNGVRYPCVSCLLADRHRRESLAESPLKGDRVKVLCLDWGRCAPCDGLTERELTFLKPEDRR